MNKHLCEPTVEFSTLVELLRWRALHQPEQPAYTFLVDGETQEIHLTYGELDRQSRTIGALLQSLGATGERALLLYPPGLEFIAAFFGCLYAGVVAVPAYPPRFNRSMSHLQNIVVDAQATVVLTTTSILSNLKQWFAEAPELAALHWLATDNAVSTLAEDWQEPGVGSNTLAFLQYTSGSTATPKGVMVSHGNLLHNSAYLDHNWEHTTDSVLVTWLPHFHDMGLIYGIIQPLYRGFRCIMMPPVSFLQRPIRWLQAISRYKATHSGGPNFAYELCVRKVTPEQRSTLDLSSWRMALNGAEPVRQKTLQRFVEAFKTCGFSWSGFCPGYGLAEATLKVSAVRKKDEPSFCTVGADALEQNRIVETVEHQQSASTLTGCGYPTFDMKIVIAHPESLTQCAPNEVGEVWVSGSSVAQGYWQRPEETERTFRAYLADTLDGPFLRTGDLGFLKDGELFITGRLKDLIIIRGRNYYPQDIELTLEQSHPALRPGCGAAFSVEVDGEEQLVITQEVERSYRRNLDVDELVGAIRQAVAKQHELHVYAVVLVKTGSIPKTSSGKIQRHACRVGFLSGNLNVMGAWTKPLQDGEPQTLYSRDKSDEQRNLLALKAADFVQRRKLLLAHIWQQMIRIIGLAPSDSFDPSKPLNELGLDSLMAVELISTLEVTLGRTLPHTLLFEYPTIESLVDYLVRDMISADPLVPLPESVEVPQPLKGKPHDSEGKAKLEDKVSLVLERRKSKRIKATEKELLYFEKPVRELEGQWVQCVDGSRKLMFATYSYLGLLGHPYITSAAKAALDRYGSGTHGVRLLGGSLDLHYRLEKRIADFLGRESAITFTSGFMTNYTTISTIVGSGDWVISDQFNHASIVDGCAASGALFRVYKHNDMKHLEDILRDAPKNVTKLVVADAIFSMDGDILDLPSTVELCQKYGAILMVDEAHSLGILGATGRGIEEHFGMPGSIDICMGTLSKTIPAVGGYIAANNRLVDFLRFSARGYIFSAAMSPPIAAAALAAFDVLENEGEERRRALMGNVNYLIAGLRSAGFNTGRTCTAIVPVIVGSDANAMAMTRYCQEHGLFVLPVLPPAVPPGTARLRLNVTSDHTIEDIQFALDVIIEAGKQVLSGSVAKTFCGHKDPVSALLLCSNCSS